MTSLADTHLDHCLNQMYFLRITKLCLYAGETDIGSQHSAVLTVTRWRYYVPSWTFELSECLPATEYLVLQNRFNGGLYLPFL